MSHLRGIVPFQKFGVEVEVPEIIWWSNGILEFCFGPYLGLRLEAGTKLNKKNCQRTERKRCRDHPLA